MQFIFYVNTDVEYVNINIRCRKYTCWGENCVEEDDLKLTFASSQETPL